MMYFNVGIGNVKCKQNLVYPLHGAHNPLHSSHPFGLSDSLKNTCFGVFCVLFSIITW